MKSRFVVAGLFVLGAIVAIGIGVQAISLRFVEWGEPLPWENGKPYVAKIEGHGVREGVMVLLGPNVVGRVSDERAPRGGVVMRIDRRLDLGRETRFELRAVDDARSIVIFPGTNGRLEPWDEVTVDVPPSRFLEPQ